jgi:hypothetical protein
MSEQIERLPACDYVHVIFTVPEPYNALWSYNRVGFTNLLMRAGWETLREMLGDPKHLGALPGAVAGFHSWGQTLWVHPHAHFLVSAGGIDEHGHWKPCPHSGLLPARALSAKFRGKLRAWLIREILAGRLVLPPGRSRQHPPSPPGPGYGGTRRWLNELNRLGRKKHHVMVMPRYPHGRGVIAYLARYLKGGCVSDRRLTQRPDGAIQLAYKDNHCNPPKRQTLVLTAEELIGRVLGHVPPTGQHVIRSYGLFATAKGKDLAAIREQLGELPTETDDELPASPARLPAPHSPCCPVCGARLLTRSIPRSIRAPPSTPSAA